MTIRFQHRLEALYGLERRKDKLGLEGTRALLGALGNPHERFRSVHVAGTNGKGSTCALIERVLREAGIRTGLYTSPHLVDFRERIRVNGRWVDGGWLEKALDRIEALPEGKDRTFFEVATALGFLYFAEQGVEIAVVETGLGGRLDCTNVITPEVSVITSIGLDHTEILGDTIEKIAWEKAGIIKPGVPFVTGITGGPAARVFRQASEERGAPWWRFDPGTPRPDDPAHLPGRSIERTDEAYRIFLIRSVWGDRVELPVDRRHPGLLNEGLSLDVLAMLVERGFAIPWSAITRALVQIRWPGRFERCPTEARLWWDGAHNVSGAMKLDRLWGYSLKRPGAIVLALSRDKDVEGFLRVLRWDFANAVIVATRSRNERAMDPPVIAAHARAFGFGTREVEDVPSAVWHALDLAGQGAVLLTGSLFAVGEAMESFGGAPGELL